MIINSKSIKMMAQKLGFDKVGVSRAVSLNKERKNLETWISEKKSADMDWIKKRKDERVDIRKYFNEAKIIYEENGLHSLKRLYCSGLYL